MPEIDEMSQTIGRMEAILIQLQATATRLENRVDELENLKNRGLGFFAAIALAGGAVGAAAKTVIAEIFQ